MVLGGCVVRAEAVTQLVLGRCGATEDGTRRRWSRGSGVWTVI